MYKLEWKSYPSVSPGGKKYFWHCSCNGERFASVIWNRRKLSYAIEVKGMNMEYIDNLNTAKKRVEFILQTRTV